MSKSGLGGTAPTPFQTETRDKGRGRTILHTQGGALPLLIKKHQKCHKCDRQEAQAAEKNEGPSSLPADRLWEYSTAAPGEMFRIFSPGKEKIQRFLMGNLNDRGKKAGILEAESGKLV